MLKLRYLFENFEQAEECLKFYEPDEASFNEMFRYFRISSNAIYPFRDKSGRICFLRLSPAEEKALEEVESEIHIIRWLVDRGFPAMEPVPMRDGTLCRRMETQWGTVNVSCFRKVPGKALENTEGILGLCFGYGKTLGQLHKLLTDCPYGESRKKHASFLEETGERLRRYGAPEPVLTEFDSVRDELSRLPVTREAYGIVHYDFEPDNVLFDPNTNSFGVIDFDDSIRFWYALDAVRAIDALDDIVEQELLPKAEDAFLRGYRSEKEFSDSQMASLPLMRRTVQIQSYATTLHVMSEKVSDAPDWMTEICEKLTNVLRRIEAGIVSDYEAKAD